MQNSQDKYFISPDKSRLDVPSIHEFLSTQAIAIDYEVVDRSGPDSYFYVFTRCDRLV